MMLLGGGNSGREIAENFQIEMRKCLSAYLKDLHIALLRENDTVLDLQSYCVRVADFNTNISENLYLLPGIIDVLNYH